MSSEAKEVSRETLEQELEAAEEAIVEAQRTAQAKKDTLALVIAAPGTPWWAITTEVNGEPER